MQPSNSEVTYLTIVITTLLILFFVGLVVYYFFIAQKKKFLHLQEVSQIKEEFNKILLQSKLEIQEQTLDHIAKELHANFSHLVSLININLSAILADATEKTRDGILETKSLAKQLMSDLRSLSSSLNSDYLLKTGFLKAISNELDRLSKTGKFTVTFSKTGQEIKLTPEKEIILFRLCQEVLNNIVKHSKARTIQFDIKYSEDSLELAIRDDGIGFNLDKAKEVASDNGSTGISNIYNRAKLIHGDLDIDSIKDLGTTVSIIIPIEKSPQ